MNSLTYAAALLASSPECLIGVVCRYSRRVSADALARSTTVVPAPRQQYDDSLAAFVVRFVVPGVIATTLIAVGSLGVGWIPVDSAAAVPFLNAFRGSTLGTIASSVFVAIGVGMLLHAWLQLGQGVTHGLVDGVRRQWLALAAWSVPLLLTPPLFSRDVYSYVAQGRLMAADINPYDYGPSVLPGAMSDGVDPLWADAPAPYGQLFLTFAQVIAHLTGQNVFIAALLFRILAVVGVALIAWSVPKIAEYCGVDPAKALWLAVLNPLVLVHFISGAHNDALMIGAIAAGLALIAVRHPIWGIGAIALGGAIKGTGLIALPFAGLMWAGPGATKSAVVRAWAGAATIAVGVLAFFGWFTGTGISWLSAMSAPGEVRTWLSPPTAIGMAIGYPLELISPGAVDTSVVVVRAIFMIVGLGLILYLILRPPGGSAVRALGLALLVVVLFGPVVQPWYLLWALPLLAAAGLSRREENVVVGGTLALSLFSLGSHFLDGVWYH